MRIIRSDRRTLAIIIESDGSLTVRSPVHLSQPEIDRFLTEKKLWIQSKQSQAINRALPVHNFETGESFSFLGNDYLLKLVDDPKQPLELKDIFLLDRRLKGQGREIFSRWYRNQARAIFSERLAHYSALHRMSYNKLRISSAKTRWGSCSAHRTISMTWRLVMAPLPVVDYVIFHELVHLEIPNHSSRFWSRLAQFNPDYLEHRKWLKDNGARLIL